MVVSMLALSFKEEFTILFQEMGPAAATFLILGLILIIIEMFVPGFGFFGIAGGICLLIGIIIRVSNSGRGNALFQFLVLIILAVLVMAILFLIVMRSLKKGVLSKTGLVQLGVTTSDGIDQEQLKEYKEIEGKTGITTTNLRPQGKIQVDNKMYDASVIDDFIDKGQKIEVVKIEGKKAIVKTLKEEKND